MTQNVRPPNDELTPDDLDEYTDEPLGITEDEFIALSAGDRVVYEPYSPHVCVGEITQEPTDTDDVIGATVDEANDPDKINAGSFAATRNMIYEVLE